MKIFAENTEDDSSTGLSGAELELMELLDKADNMLNSGSYGDFDQLIGDLNDPRLSALRQKRDGAEEGGTPNNFCFFLSYRYFIFGC